MFKNMIEKRSVGELRTTRLMRKSPSFALAHYKKRIGIRIIEMMNIIMSLVTLTWPKLDTYLFGSHHREHNKSPDATRFMFNSATRLVLWRARQLFRYI